MENIGLKTTNDNSSLTIDACPFIKQENTDNFFQAYPPTPEALVNSSEIQHEREQIGPEIQLIKSESDLKPPSCIKCECGRWIDLLKYIETVGLHEKMSVSDTVDTVYSGGNIDPKTLNNNVLPEPETQINSAQALVPSPVNPRSNTDAVTQTESIPTTAAETQTGPINQHHSQASIDPKPIAVGIRNNCEGRDDPQKPVQALEAKPIGHSKRLVYNLRHRKMDNSVKLLPQSNKLSSEVVKKTTHLCSVCKKSFKQKFSAESDRNTTNSPLKCCRCKGHTAFTTKTDNKQMSHACLVCNKIYATEFQLNLHHVIHTRKKLFKCHICEKRYTDKSRLEFHIFLHTGNKPYKCAACKKIFLYKSQLKEHQVVHSKERPYKCAVCNKGYSQKNLLKRHMIIHTGDDPYSCAECKKTFRDPYELKKHKVVHTGEKPYKCTVCGKGFGYNSSRMTHQLKRTEIKSHACLVCKKTFGLKSNLRRHQQIHLSEKRPRKK